MFHTTACSLNAMLFDENCCIALQHPKHCVDMQAVLALALLVGLLVWSVKPVQFSGRQQTPIQLICSTASETKRAAYTAVPLLACLDAYFLQGQDSLRRICGMPERSTHSTSHPGNGDRATISTAAVRSLANTVLKVIVHLHII